MNKKEQYEKDLEFGHIMEYMITPYLETLFDSEFESNCNDNRYDIKFKNELLFEIKADRSSNNIDNIHKYFYKYYKDNTPSKFIPKYIVIESNRQNGTPSGINVCRANYFVYYFPFISDSYNVYVFDTTVLRTYLPRHYPVSPTKNDVNVYYVPKNLTDTQFKLHGGLYRTGYNLYKDKMYFLNCPFFV